MDTSKKGLPPQVKQQINTLWCNVCGTLRRREDGNCTVCNERLAKEYKERKRINANSI